MRRLDVRFLLLFALLAGGLASFLLYRSYARAEDEVATLLAQQAELALEFDLAIRDYVGQEVRPRVTALLGEGEFVPETMSTSFAARSVFEGVRKRFPTYLIKFSSDNPRNPANRASPDEVRLLEYFRANPDVERWSGRVQIEGHEYFAALQPRRLKPACLRCHGDPADAPASLLTRYGGTAGFHETAGRVVAMDTVGIPLDSLRAALVRDVLFDAATVAVALVVFFGVTAFVFRRLVGRRLRRIAAHYGRMAEGDETTLLEPVPVDGNDEIGDLARSFNVLVARLADTQAWLRDQVRARTADLEREIGEREYAEKERESLARFPSENPCPIGRVAADMRVLHANRACRELLARWHSGVGLTAPARWQATVGAALATGEPQQLEVADGPCTYLLSVVPVPGEGYVNFYGADVTERRRALAAVRESEARFRTLAEMLPETVFEIDPTGTLTFVNRNAYAMFGYTEADVEAGLNCLDTLAEEDRARAAANIQGIFSGRPAEPHEYTARRTDGSTFPVLIHVVPILEAGRPVGGRGLVVDVSRQKRTEEALREARDRAQMYLDLAEVMLVALDAEGRVTLMNRRGVEVLGVTEQEALGVDWFETFLAPEKRASVREIFDGLLAGDTETYGRVEQPVRRADGEDRLIAWHNTVLRDETGRIIGTLSSGEDITDRKRAEERFQALFESSRDAIMVVAPPSWQFTCGNPAALEMFGVADEEAFRALGPWDVSPEFQADGCPSAEKARETLETAVREGSHFIEWTHRRLDGETFPATVLLTRMEVEGRMMVQATVRDVTAQQQAEAALQASEERYRSLIQNLPIGLYRNTPGPEGKFLMANPAIARMHGYDSVEEFLEVAPARLYAAPARRVAISKRLLEEGQIVAEEIRLRRKDGVPFWGAVTAHVVRDTAGAVRYFDGLVEDITVRKRAEAALREHLDFLQQMIDTIPGPVFFKDRGGVYLGCNEAFAAFLGRTRDEIVGKTVFDLAPAPLARSYHERDEALYAEPGTQVYESRVAGADGEERDVLFTKGTFTNAGGEVTGLVGVILDVTERKRAEEAVQASNEMLERLNRRLRELATTDDLTGLFNRRHFLDMMGRELQRRGRRPSDVALAMIDVDRFKTLNDSYGHAFGDRALKEVADVLRETARDTDVVARYAGDEFILLMPETRENQAVAAARRIRECLARRTVKHGANSASLTLSIGVACLEAGAEGTGDALAHRADMALYVAKDAGRDTVRAWSEVEGEGAVRQEAAPPQLEADLARLVEEAKEQFVRGLQDLVREMEGPDPGAGPHLQNTAHYAVAVAERLGLEPAEVDVIRRAALVHDIGRLCVPERVLAKPGPLTDEEFEIVKTHVMIGVRLLRQAGALDREITLARNHHERWDGAGYPDHVAGTSIPIGARILAVADALDAITSDRPHRPARSPEDALAIIAGEAGRQFDPEVVDALAAWARETGLVTPEEAHA